MIKNRQTNQKYEKHIIDSDCGIERKIIKNNRKIYKGLK